MFTVQIDLPFLTNMTKDSVRQYNIHPNLCGHFLYSKQYDFLDQEDLHYAQSIFPKSFQFHEYSHSHFWPLVDPDDFSENIVQLISKEDK